jgi:hypothetical protein
MDNNVMQKVLFKKAFIDKIMLGFILIAMVIIFIATISDDLSARNTYTNLKKIIQSAALASAKYYTKTEQNTANAEAIAKGIVAQTKLGDTIKDNLVFTWDFISEPNNVKVKIENYQHNLFWYRFLNMDSFTFPLIEAKANIIDNPTDELPNLEEVNNFMPFAINQCGQENLTPGENYSFIYKPYELYTSDEGLGFYGLSPNNPAPRTGSQSDFAHFKNEVLNFNRFSAQQYLVDSSLDAINNDAQQLASALEIHKFNQPMSISVALLDCNSTKDNIIISNLVQVEMTNIYCGDKATSTVNKTTAFTTEDTAVFENVSWVKWVESKDCSQSGLFRIDLQIKVPEEKNVLLEY